MLAEHMITKPVFDAMFGDYEFIRCNPVSQIMQEMLDILDEKALDKEQETLNKFYASVQERAKDIDNAAAKQKVMIELYEQFFKNALPKQVAKLGIVYTPVEIVDFIISSVNSVLADKFGKSLNDEGVHVLDPFTGTGTFIARLLRSGFIDKNKLLYKYTNEIHANEIVLLAYYIATINIEETFHDIMETSEYTPFEGIVLTDTFALSESVATEVGNVSAKAANSLMFEKNSERAIRQLESPITVIIGNPPYSVGQKSGNDNNQNMSYEKLDKSLAQTYAAKSKATLTRNVYDTYIRAFRWAADRIGDNGIIGFVSNGAYLDGVALDGFRQCLLEDFNSVYVFNLRGNQRTSGELSRKEGGKIFGFGSRTPVAITLLVKKKGVKKDGYVRYYDIGDYLTREQKLAIIKDFGDMRQIPWKIITPNENNDWISQRNSNFINFMALGDKKKREKESIFLDNYPSGLSTNRDVWVYGFTRDLVLSKAGRMIEFYNNERKRCLSEYQSNESLIGSESAFESFVTNIRSNDATKISWSAGLTNKLISDKEIALSNVTSTVVYRPFCKKVLAYTKDIIERPSRWDSIFPVEGLGNFVICVSGAPIKKGFSVLMTNCIQDLHLLENSQSFPMFFYDKVVNKDNSPEQLTFSDNIIQQQEQEDVRYKQRNAISDAALSKFRERYGNKVTKEDIFYYIYAVLQSKGYIAEYEDNLTKEMPRIPYLDKFPEYVRIGKALADIHVNYEYEVNAEDLGLTVQIDKEDYRVEKMRFKKDGKNTCKDTIIFNQHITIGSIPERAYEYVVNGKSAIEWVMERYAVTVDKDSGISDDPNEYAGEKYIYNPLLSVIDVSLKTLDLIDSMPDYKEI